MTRDTPAPAADDTAAGEGTIPAVCEPAGSIRFVDEAELAELEQSGQGRRARPIDLEIAGVAPRD